MCGICGIVYKDAGAPVEREVLFAMRDLLVHRGPDDQGSYVEPGVGLGHRRLSIIDLETGAQPMQTSDGKVTIVFNGEIYNYIELRRQHLDEGALRTRSDTEVILGMYQRYGTRCVEHFNGMFAFALWDSERRRLVLARDRLGIKPLYYVLLEDRLLFASEMKSLLVHPGVSRTLRPEAVEQFLTFGYVQGVGTLFAQIQRLAPGTLLVMEGGRVRTETYWDVDFKPDPEPTPAQWKEQLLGLLTDSIRLRLRSDVPLGVLLSGGIDSSTVVALLQRAVPGNVSTYSIGFDAGAGFNELEYARLVARTFGTRHKDMILESEAFQDFIPRFVWYMDEPVTEGAAIPLFYVSRLASSDVKVILSGEGADELFAGYPIYGYMRWLERYRRVPRALRRGLLSPALLALSRSPKMEKYLSLAELPIEERYLGVHLYDRRPLARLLSPGFAALLGGRRAVSELAPLYEKTRGWNLLSRLQYLDLKAWLPDDILIKADRMSMANSLELRVPFLDHRLVELAAKIPPRLRMRGLRTKILLKEAMKGILPDRILHRGKMGFPTPLGSLFRSDLSRYLREILLDGSLGRRGYFRMEEVERLVGAHLAGTHDHHRMLWRLVVLEEWHRAFVDGKGAMRGRVDVRAGV